MTTLPPRQGRRTRRGTHVGREDKLKGRAVQRLSLWKFGAGKESRTPDLNLGKVALYQLSYSRIGQP